MVDAVTAPAPGRPNQDAFGVGGSLAWVLDGVSPLAGEPTAAARFAREVSGRLRTSGAPPPAASLQDVLAAASSSIATPGRAAAGLLRRTEHGFEYAVLADVYIAVGADETRVISDQRMRPVNAEGDEAIAGAIAEGATLEEARAATETLLQEQRRTRMNRPGKSGYWVLTADGASARHALTGAVDRRPDEPVLVCSDGFARLVLEAGAYDWGELVSAAMTTGLVPLLDELRDREARDPRDGGFVRLSRHDDATALLMI